MKLNVGNTDRILRVIGGIVVLLAGYYFKAWWGLVGLIPLLTGLIGWCPLYAILGISTCKVK
jgi:hypothetical protein